MFIQPINSGVFFGLNNNVETLISFSGTTSTYPININTIRALSVGIDGDISFSNNNMESNLNNSVYKASSICYGKLTGMTPRQHSITLQMSP